MRRIAVLLVAAGLLVWLAAPGLSARPFVPRAVEFEQALSTKAWTRTDDRTWRSPVVRAPRRFDLVGLRWERAVGAELQARIRVRGGDGRWGRWTLMAQDHAGGAGAEPVWAGGADAYQLRTDGARRPRGLQARFVNATGTATAGDRLRTSLRRTAHSALAAIASTPAGAQAPIRGAPAIIPREAWGADQCEPRAAPAYGQVQLGYVHHTVNANTYAPQDSAAIVLSICRYHRNENGWRDIGYNFLVDRYGQIFEGRAGGIDQPVIGAQAQGYNGVSTGVASIGTFSQEPQTEAGVAATAELMAWKMSLHGAAVAGQVTVTSAGGPSNRYATGRLVTFERIAGHRDADRTTCPGDAFFAQLPQIRARAAELAPQFAFAEPIPPAHAVSLQAADPTLDFPQPAQLSGQASAFGVPLAGAPIAVQIATGRGFSTLARVTTNPDGTWSAPLPTQYSRSLRAVATLPDGALVASPAVNVEVAPTLRVRAPRRVTARRRFTVSGSMRPRRAQVVLVIARAGADGQMHTVARVPLKVRRGRIGRFSSPVRLRRPALHRIRVVFAGDGRNAPARSADLLLRAVRAR
ncbi:MAG TPA: N-acetylmuramoyl-L-alanine amidase [Solirubrobacteraceae bacterium]|nr:N-acetylmuramoyl-L-alanine amidase [Solirubrobacteraceae bacterium]